MWQRGAVLMIIRGVEMAWVEVDTLRFPGVPLGTSVRGIALGEPCPYCDLGLDGFVCACPPSEPWPAGLITIDTRGLL